MQKDNPKSRHIIRVLSVIFFLVNGITWTNSPVLGQNTPRTVRPRQEQGNQQDEELQRARSQERSARRFESRGNYEQALTIYQSLMNQFPHIQSFFDGVQRNLISLGLFDESIALLEMRIANPQPSDNVVTLYAELGGTYHLEGDEGNASIAWAQARANNPLHPRTYSTIANVMLRMRLIDLAIDEYKRGREALGHPYEYAVNLANLYHARLNWELSAREYIYALRESENRKDYVLRNLANFPADSLAFAAIEGILEEELSQDNLAEYWNGYTQALMEIQASLYMRMERYPEALEIVRRIDQSESEPGYRLVSFAIEVHNEGLDSLSLQALQYAYEIIRDPRERAGIEITRASIIADFGCFEDAVEILNQYCNDGFPREVEQRAYRDRAAIWLHHLYEPELAKNDLEILLTLREAGNRSEIWYEYAQAAVYLSELDDAVQAIDSARYDIAVREMNLQRRRSRIEIPVELIANLAFLDARITWWQGDLATALEILNQFVQQPNGARAENDMLDLVRTLSNVSGEETQIAILAGADLAEFKRQYDEAERLFSEISSDSTSQLAPYALWRIAELYKETENPATPDKYLEFAGRYEDHPYAEQALYFAALWWEDIGDTEQAAEQYESLILEFPYGLLASEARVKLEQLQGEEPPLLLPDIRMEP